jgi:deoxyadenosine/deoxycytidine kinase
LKRLDRNYENWISSYDMGEVLVLETDQLDYIHDLVHRLDVMERIEAVLPKELGRPGR